MKSSSGHPTPHAPSASPLGFAMALKAGMMSFLVAISLTACKPEEPAPPPEPKRAPEATQGTARPRLSKEESRARMMQAMKRARGRESAAYHRGAYSPPSSPDMPLPVRAMIELNPDQKARLTLLLQQVQSGNLSRDAALNVIAQVRDLISPDALPLLTALLKHSDKDVRGTAMATLLGTQDKRVLPVIDQALADAEADVRLQAIEATEKIIDPAVAPILTKAFSDTDMNVRQLAFQSALQQDDTTKQNLLASAISSKDQDLANAGVGYVEFQSSKQTIPLMMGALDHPDAFIREKAHDTLFLIMHQDFKTADQAKTWWSQNQAQFDDNLVIRDVSTFPTQ